MKYWFSKYWLPIVIFSGLLCFIILVDVFRSECWAKPFSDFLNRRAMVLSAAAAFTLAVAAVWAVRTTADQTGRMINENRRNRGLDFKIRQLGKIVDWAKEARKELLMVEHFLSGDFKTRLEICAIENDWVIMTAGIFGEEFKKIVGKAAKDLWAYIDALKPVMKDRELYEREVPRSFNKVLASALKVEAELTETRLA